MNEITVLVDIRPSSDSPDLLLVRRKLAIVGGELQFVGDPVEAKVPLSARRAKITLSGSIDGQLGFALVARVQNIGLAPLKITKAEFEYRFGALRLPPESKPTDQIAIGLMPRDREATGALLPGESREWVLPFGYYGSAFPELSRLGPEDYRVVAYAGSDTVAEVPGRDVEPFLDSLGKGPAGATWGVPMPLPMQHKLAAMEPDTRNRILDSVRDLRQRPVETWATTPGVRKVDEFRYFLTAPPDYRALVHRYKTGAVELLDVLRLATPDETAVATTSGSKA